MATSVDARPRDLVKPHTQTRGEYRPDIDGVRGAAAIMVMGFHAKVPGFEGGYIGLDLFFVLSGYVIAGLLMDEYARDGAIRWGAFYARRARRLIPAKATMLVVVLALSYFVLAPTGPQQQTARSAVAAAGFVSNYFFMNASDISYFGHQPGTGVLLHTWSLSVEEQFYLALPLAILVAWLMAKLLRIPLMRTLLFTCVALTAVSLWLAVQWGETNPNWAYYMPITRAFEFLIGVALAHVARRLRLAEDLREVMGLAGVAICAFLIWKPMPVDSYPSYWALLPCLAAALVVWAGVGSPTLVTRLLSWRVLVFLGLVSYGWYLWHWPFLVLGESYNLAPPSLWMRVALVLAALGVAYLSYRYIEGRFYKRSGAAAAGVRGWGQFRVIVVGVTAMASVAALGSAAIAVAESDADSTRWHTVEEQQMDTVNLPDVCLSGQSDAIIPPRPVRCDLRPFDPDQPTVVLWGDSHAWMLIPALEPLARRNDVNLVAFVMGGCPPFLAPEGLGTGCARNNAMALDFVEDRRKAGVRVILSASYETYRGDPAVGLLADAGPRGARDAFVKQQASYFADFGPALYDRLGELGVGTDVVGPTPVMRRSAPLCEARTLRAYPCDTPRSQAIVDEDENLAWIRENMASLPRGSRLIDVARGLCTERVCFAEADGVVYYFDDNHVSRTRARGLSNFFAPTVRAVAAQR